MNNRLAVTAAAAAMATGLVLATTTLVAPASATTPACRAAQLRPHYDGQQGAAGTLYDLWHVTNLGTSCQVKGWVHAQNFRHDGRPLRTVVHRQGTAATVVLGHGQSAHWRFSFTNPSILNCTAEPAVNMIVTMPGDTHPLLAGRGERSCHGSVDASPLQFGV
jgi:hypothetical protein